MCRTPHTVLQSEGWLGCTEVSFIEEVADCVTHTGRAESVIHAARVDRGEATEESCDGRDASGNVKMVD